MTSGWLLNLFASVPSRTGRGRWPYLPPPWTALGPWWPAAAGPGCSSPSVVFLLVLPPHPPVFCVQSTSLPAMCTQSRGQCCHSGWGNTIPHSSFHPAHLLLLNPSGPPLTRPPVLSLCPRSCLCPFCSSLKMAPWPLSSSSAIRPDVPFSVGPATAFKTHTTLGFPRPGPAAFSFLALLTVLCALDCMSWAQCGGHRTGT